MGTESIAELSGRAEASWRDGAWESAVELYSELFQRCARAGDVVRLLDALRRQAEVLNAHLEYDRARELAELRWEIAERNGLRGETARAINNAAAIRHYQGDLAGAEREYLLALERARRVRDDALIGNICQNLGVIASVRGELHRARALYLESMASVVRSGNWTTAVMVYNNLGMVSTDLQEWMQAEVCFRRGIEVAEQLGERVLVQLGNLALLARLHMNRAEPLIRIGELRRAREALDRSEPIANQVDDRRALADLSRFRGMIARLEGDLAAAGGHLARALLLAAEAGAHLERAEALEELARVRRAEARTDDALAVLREARQGFGALGARRDVERAEALLAEWTTADLLADWRAPA